MKLYLSSDGFLTKAQFKELVGKRYKEARVGLIMNAVDWRTPSERKVRYHDTKKLFRKVGIKPELIDLRKFYGKSIEALVKKLKHYDLLWVRGGNTYYLRYVMRKSGFDRAIKRVLVEGLVYAGESAGALVVGPTLKHIEEADRPEVAPKVVWQGIGLVKIVPLPHWGSKKYSTILRKAFLALRKEKTRVSTLRDGEAVLVKGNSMRKVRTNRAWRS